MECALLYCNGVSLLFSLLLQYRPIMLGELSTNGNFSALLMHQLTKTWKVKLNAQVLGVKTTSYITLSVASVMLNSLVYSVIVLRRRNQNGLAIRVL